MRHQDSANSSRIIFQLVQSALFSLTVCIGSLIASPSAYGGCYNHDHWRARPRPDFIPVYIRDDAGQVGAELGDFDQSEYDADSINLAAAEIRVEVIAAIQAWNDAGTGAPRFVFAGYTKGRVDDGADPDDMENPLLPPNSVLVVAGGESLMMGTVGLTNLFTRTSMSDSYSTVRFRVALATGTEWTRNPVPGVGQSDLQAVLVHEFGHILGLGHPWIAREIDVAGQGITDSFCRHAPTPGATAAVPAGATVGVMHYLHTLVGPQFDIEKGAGRFPWRDDIETSRLGHATLHEGVDCRTSADCTECPPDYPDCDLELVVCRTAYLEDKDEDGAVVDNPVFPSCETDDDCLACPVDMPDCDVTELEGSFCARRVRAPWGSTTNSGNCAVDSQCQKPGTDPSQYVQRCDPDSLVCVDITGRCTLRRCTYAEPRDYVIATSPGAHFDQPTWVPREDGLGMRTSIYPPALSGESELIGRRVGLATVDNLGFVNYVDALDGAWCTEVPLAPVDPNPETGRTWSRPAVTTGSGRAMVAWMTEDRDTFKTKIRYAIRGSGAPTWLHYGEIDTGQGAKSFAVAHSGGSGGQFLVAYVDKDLRVQARSIDPFTGAPLSSSTIFDLFSVARVQGLACAGNDCESVLMDGAHQSWSLKGNVLWDFPDLELLGTNVGLGGLGYAGSAGALSALYPTTEAGSVGAPFERLRTASGSLIDLAWFGADVGPSDIVADRSPGWSASIGTYAPQNAGDAQLVTVARGVGGVGEEEQLPPMSGPSLTCCSNFCGPPDPGDDPELLEGCPDPTDPGLYGLAGCPCAPIITETSAVEDCALAGMGPLGDEICDAVTPDGTRPDRWCHDGTGLQVGTDVVCAETTGGNHICKECGNGGTMGCPCTQVDCEFEDLGCWGENWGSGSDPRCWPASEPPGWVCIEQCQMLGFFAGSSGAVCVGPHLGEDYSVGSPYLYLGQFPGHGAYCGSPIDCGAIIGVITAGACEESSFGTDVCSEGAVCGPQCETDQDCWNQGYPAQYACSGGGLSRCMVLSACDVKPGGCP